MRKLSILALLLLLFSACQESLDERIRRETSEFNKRRCPQKIDEFVTLDSISYIIHENGDEANDYIYNYSLRCDSSELELFYSQKSELERRLVSKIKNAQDLRFIKEAGCTIHCLFKSPSTHKELLSFKFTQTQYQ